MEVSVRKGGNQNRASTLITGTELFQVCFLFNLWFNHNFLLNTQILIGWLVGSFSFVILLEDMRNYKEPVRGQVLGLQAAYFPYQSC